MGTSPARNGQAMSRSPTETSMPNSSCSSRFRDSSGVSPASILPPGNSQRPSHRSPFFLLAMSTRPSSSMTAAVTLRTGYPDRGRVSEIMDPW